MKKNKLIHVSFEEVEQFIPRIPEQICPGEDNTTPRICAAPSVIKALQAIPQAGEVIYYMRRIGVPIIIHAYYLESQSVLTPDQIADKVPDALVAMLEDEGWIVRVTYGGCTDDGQLFCHKGWMASQKLRETPEWSKSQKAEYERLDAILAENRNESFCNEKIEEVCMKKNYELELYKLIMQPDEDDPDISWVDEFGWICGEEFCVWVNLLFFKDFMERFKEIFGSEVLDEGGIHAKIQEDCVCFALEDIMEGYGVELENVFPKDKYKH